MNSLLPRCTVGLGFIFVLTLLACQSSPPMPPNILFIAVDDLRPELGCYGADHIHSPHIDRLAAQGTTFLNAYCNIPVCGASRASLLTGLRPTLTRFKRYYTRADEDAPGVLTLPGCFKSQGYQTISNGKISHIAADNEEDWSEIWKPSAESPRDYLHPINVALDTLDDSRGPPVESVVVGDEAYRDGKITLKALSDLDRLQQSDQPFFLAVGFLKPHLPFNAPQQYWDLYDRNKINLPTNRDRPTDVPKKALHHFGELRHYAGVPEEGPVSDSMALSLIHGYYACVSYTDAQIGKLLDKLEELNLMENTVIILWGDHGWNLLEHGLWCKHSNYRTSLKAPLIVHVPNLAPGQKRHEMVEFVDIYPTLQELAGLPDPGHLEGTSLVPLLGSESVPWKKEVVSIWNNGITQTSQEYAFTKWVTPEDSVVDMMLFDHRVDPGENRNLIGTEAGLEFITSVW